jgi:U6 snRNA-associated Sm-like protein LSm4
VYIRGNTIKYLRVPDEVIDNVDESDVGQKVDRAPGPGRGRGGSKGKGKGRGGKGKGKGKGDSKSKGK